MNVRYLIGIMLYGITSGAGAFEPGATIPRQQDDLPTTMPKELPAEPLVNEPKRSPSLSTKGETERMQLQKVIFTGNSVFSSEELNQLAAEYVGKFVSRMDIETLRMNLVQHYRTAGYINSGVILPDQQVKEGVVHFYIVEGHLGKIHIQGAERLSPSYIQKRLQSTSDEPFNQAQLLERFQLLLNDSMIERLNGALKPSAQPGVSDMDLTVTRRKAYEINLGIDNYTPATVGAYTGRLDGTVRNLTGWGDSLRVDLNYSEGLQGIGSVFSLPLFASETRLNLNFQGNQSSIIEAPLKSLNIENDFYHLSAGISHPLYHTARRQFTVEGLFAYRYTRNFVLGVPIGLAEGVDDNGKAKVSVLRFSQNYQDKGNNHVVSLRSTFSVGIDAFNSTTHTDQADTRFFSWLGQARVVRRLGEHAGEFFLRGDLQISNDVLLPLERFAVGGVYTVRGYRQNELVRDNGYAVAAEYRYPLLSLGDHQEHNLKLVPFVDYGRAWNNPSQVTLSNSNPSKTLWSMGVGLQWQWQQMQADVYWAHAMTSPNAPIQQRDLQDDGVYFRVSTRVF